jgi:putative two-component system response regulator
MHAHHLPTFQSLHDGVDGGCSIQETQAALLALGEAVEQRDGHTGTHCQRLAHMGVAIGVCMGLDRDSLVALYCGGYLHDVGKVGIPDSILLKPGKLTPGEWITMRSHTTRGEQICRHIKTLASVLPIIRNHHERWDGSGYPDGLKGKEIPLLARVLQVVDIYDALTNPRPYREACSTEHALQIVTTENARGWRDPEVVRIFLALHDKVTSRPVADDGSAAVQASLTNLDHSLRETLPAEEGFVLRS